MAGEVHDVIEGDGHGVLHESGHARRRSGFDEGPHALHLRLVQRYRDLLCRHTKHHTSGVGAVMRPGTVPDDGSDVEDDPERFRVTITVDEEPDGKPVLTLRQLHAGQPV